MPGKKNKRGPSGETEWTKKNNAFFDKYLSDLRMEGNVKDVYPGRVVRNMGNGRMEVFYTDYDGAPCLTNALIPGRYRGKGKHSVSIHVNSVVLVADSGISGSCQFEIMACLSYKQIGEIQRVFNLDSRITAYDNTDESALLKGEGDDCGIEFRDDEIPDDDNDGEVDVDNI
jgi:hypothetical protein